MHLDSIHPYLQERASRNEFSGVVRIDVAGKTVLREGYGWASRAWRVPCTPATRFDTASITKLFTAVAVLQQVELGAFALDTAVTSFLTELDGTTISSRVTPYQLLTHTSGIADDADEEAGESYEELFVDRPNYSIRQTADFLPQFAYKPATFEPGTSCRYCNVAYVLLGLMVERATGTTYRDYVQEHIFGRAGMTQSGFFSMDVVEADVAEGAEPLLDANGEIRGWRRNIYSYPPVGSPDGGAHVTADDLVRFHGALVAGKLLGAEQTAAVLSPHENYRERGDGMHKTGYGFEFATDTTGDVVCYWKEGINVGVSGALSHYPRQDVTAVVLSNMEGGAWDPIAKIQALVSGS
ncbi:MAG: serine hydrolase domain-containing protein [Candidatus Nanopelagicales bacterium]